MLRSLICSYLLRCRSSCNRRSRLRLLDSSYQSHRIYPPSFLIQNICAYSPSISSSATAVDDNFEVFITDKPVESVNQTDMKISDIEQMRVKKMDDSHELFRQKKLKFLCNQIPLLKLDVLISSLDGESEWIRLEDAAFIVLHCLIIHNSDAGFWVYMWMMQKQWFKFNFNLATILVKCLGKQLKITKCREVFDHIINQRHIPSESTFYTLLVSYITAPVHGCLDEACNIYNKMLQLGQYKPRITLQKALLRAIIRKPRRISKHFLKQAEFIFKNLVDSGHAIPDDIYGGLILVHSYQDQIDIERIASIREIMQKCRIKEGDLVLLSLMRAFSKEGSVEEVENAWEKLSESEMPVPAEAYECKITVYGASGEPMKSLAVFKEMKEKLGTPGFSAYHKIIEVLSKAKERQMAECIMTEFINTGVKTLTPSYINLLKMYFCMGLHKELELAFYQCLELCSPNGSLYSIYLDSLVESGNLDKADDVFKEMTLSGSLRIDKGSCNTILRGYIHKGDYVKAKKMYLVMCRNGYDVDTSTTERLLDNHCVLKLSEEQREILVGLLLGGLQIGSDKERKNHTIFFNFCEKNNTHTYLRRCIHTKYYDLIRYPVRDDVPYKFSTISHPHFRFYTEQFRPNGRFVIPRLIHRWISPRALAYWYMYAGYRLPIGDILLKMRGDDEGVRRVVMVLKRMSVNCMMRKTGDWYWLALQKNNSKWFWKLTEPYILDDVMDILKVGGISRIYDDESVGSPVSDIKSDDTKTVDL